MTIFAISDLHLSGTPPLKPMDMFGTHWINHWEKLAYAWKSTVSPQDTVLLPGDLSWAMRWEDAWIDLFQINQLPGRKIISRGNHDYWWQTLKKMNLAAPDQMLFLHNTFTVAESYAICASRGWLSPSDPMFSPTTDIPIYKSELKRIRTSLTAAQKAGHKKLLLMLHYPPACSPEETNPITELLEEFCVETCIYGHLHGIFSSLSQPTMILGSTKCHLVSCDALDFQPLPLSPPLATPSFQEVK